jgi:hypothetical protein
MKQQKQSLGYFILIFGIALIVTGFFIFIPEEKRNHIFWLDLIVICLIYLINFANIFGLIGIYFDFNKQIAGLGIRLVYIRFYSLFAIAIILICWIMKVSFIHQFFLQLLGLFFLSVAFFLSQLSSGKATSVATEQDALRKGKDDVLKAINSFEILFSVDSSKWIKEKTKIEFLKEDVRYLSPSNNPSAYELDTKILSTLNEAYDSAIKKNEGGTEIIALLNKCEELLKLRKNMYSN